MKTRTDHSSHSGFGRLAALVAAIALVSVATAATALATADVEATRLAGTDRYQTSRAIAGDTFGDGATVAVVASGADFPDALAASYLAGANDAPVVLTQPDQLSEAAEQALSDLDADGVLVVGGEGAVSAEVVTQLENAGYTVERIFGANRFSTARAVAESVPAEQIGSLEVGVGRTALLASGLDFPDALAGGPLAYDAAFPLLLTPPGLLSDDAKAAIESLGIEQVVILGGEGAVSASVATAVADLGVEVLRVFGADRTSTATEIADLAVTELGFSVAHANLARGDAFPDALSGSAHAGAEQAVILLTPAPTALGAAAEGWLEDHATTLTGIHVFGGNGAVTDAVVDDAEVAAGRTP